ncbi:MAG: hypothetical protein ACYCVH_14055 [Ignavibacteriaceae bacterium]
MNSKISQAAFSIIIETICLSLVGWLFAGKYIFYIHTTGFTYLIFGVSSILLINILKYFPTKYFLLSTILFALIFAAGYYNPYMPLAAIRNLLWYVVIGSSIYISSNFLSQEKYKKRKFLGAAVWMINFAVVYLLMTLLNTYLFKIYDSQFINRFLIIAFNMGTSMGLGIGIGYEISKSVIKLNDD